MKISRLIVLAFIIPMLLTSCSRFKETSFGDYSEAEKAYNQGKYKKAVEKYQSYLAQNPQGNLAIIAQYYTAKSQAALGNADEARKNYELVIAKYPNSDWAAFSKTRLEELTVSK